ncbi:MAG: sulfite exporter TauE/SafE family protein [Anaerolineaceae bacterium]|nr:MAG: sulfite exporter TauE/SafE family protein [Anaerolineaceae bacterium]
MPTHWFGLLVIGGVAGVLSGLFGIGGGVVIVPALVIFLGFTEIEAISTSLGALLLPVGALAVIAYYRQNLLRLRDSAWIAAGLLLTTALGSLGALQLEAINPDLLKSLYGVFLFYVGWRFVAPRRWYATWRDQTPPAAIDGSLDPATSWPTVFAVGLVAGIASGLFGIGGGAVIVPALTALLKYDQKLAVGTSLGALLLPVGLPGVLVYMDSGVLDLGVAALVAVGLALGAIVGANIALSLPSATVKRMYGLFLFFVAARFIFG